jgi:lipoprotein-anchoring transpeptidase ErfK/SrfK
MSSRRTFLKLASTLALGGVLPRLRWGLDPHAALLLKRPGARLPPSADWPTGPAVHLGRGALGWGAPILSRPHPEGVLLGHVWPDDVVRIVRSVVGLGMAYHTHVWFELDEGYVYSTSLQPVQNLPQTPLASVPADGVWTEISVPYVDARARPDPDAPLVYRLYWSAVFRILEVVTGTDGQPWYRVGMETQITMFAPAAAFRVVQADEIIPISPEVDPAEKSMVVYLSEQAISAFEGKREVYRMRISSGANYFGEDGVTLLNGTPQGAHNIWAKRISRHMQGGTVDAGYDVPGVGWVAYFASNGAALHSTYWHNDYGVPKSHGCLNCRPEDAKWLFRWSAPSVAYQPGDVTVDWEHRGTVVDLRGAHT